jgi:hypothetical protein
MTRAKPSCRRRYEELGGCPTARPASKPAIARRGPGFPTRSTAALRPAAARGAPALAGPRPSRARRARHAVVELRARQFDLRTDRRTSDTPRPPARRRSSDAQPHPRQRCGHGGATYDVETREVPAGGAAVTSPIGPRLATGRCRAAQVGATGAAHGSGADCRGPDAGARASGLLHEQLHEERATSAHTRVKAARRYRLVPVLTNTEQVALPETLESVRGPAGEQQPERHGHDPGDRRHTTRFAAARRRARRDRLGVWPLPQTPRRPRSAGARVDRGAHDGRGGGRTRGRGGRGSPAARRRGRDG